MTYRTPASVREEFRAHPRRALLITTVVHESRAVKAHLTNPEILIGEKDGLYEYARFPDPAGDWLIVHAITPQGNTDASLVASKAHQEFGSFHALMFVGVAGSLKDDIPIGTVVVGDYVYNGHSAKVEDTETLSRPHALAPARELLTASQGLIYSEEWTNMIRAPFGMALPSAAEYPCDFPPLAVIKGIVSGEEVVAGGKSSRYVWLRSHFNDCGAVEMEGWGVMNAARYENTPAIVVRGISDMCAGKDHAKDKLHQPIAAGHAAAFAFSILSFRSRSPAAERPAVTADVKKQMTSSTTDAEASNPSSSKDPRMELVFNFEGSKDDWTQDKVDAVIERLKQATGDDTLTLVRIDVGSVRLVVTARERHVADLDLTKLREDAAECGVTLLGAIPLASIGEADRAKEALAAASIDLLGWDKTLPNGRWITRPERETIEARFHLETSSTVLLGEPGSGKSALLSKIASDLRGQGATVFGIKADFLSTSVRTEADLQQELRLPSFPSELVIRMAALQPVYVFIDQLDALASQLDLRSERLNVLLNFVRRIGGTPNVHILLSARTFEFNHDVRLRAVEAESVTLALPPWHEVKERLTEVGIDPDAWPEKARDLVRIPQALKTFIALVNAGRKEPFTTYQAMLEQFWTDRIASAKGSDNLIMLASDLARQMAEEEALWLAASRFDDRLNALKRLEALGLIVRSDSGFSVAFNHQTVFEYVLARTFVRTTGLLSTYVLERQDSLFVRAKVWSALNYLREAEVTSYEREFFAIWRTNGLRRHIRLLLIEFLGQVRQPLPFEKACMAEVLTTSELRVFGLKAIGSNSEWFLHFASTAIRDAMSGNDAEAAQALRLLTLNWNTDKDRVVGLIRERWLPYPERDSYSWMAAHDCPSWNDAVEEIAITILRRSAISIWQVGHTAMTLAVGQPDVAMRLVRAKLDFLLATAKGTPAAPPDPKDSTENEQLSWHIRNRPTKELEHVLDAVEWNDLPSLAEAAPAVFLQHLWPWYVAVFSEVIARRDSENVTHLYPSHYVLEMELPPADDDRPLSRERPVMSAIQTAVEIFAKKTPDDFSKWADENSKLELLPVQQLIGRGYEMASERLALHALDWMLADNRRFQLGSSYGLRDTTIALVRACAVRWREDEVARYEKAVLSYRPRYPDHLKEPEQRKYFVQMIRATRKDLLRAVGIERLTAESRELVATEQRALGDRFDRSMSHGEAGFIGSPMAATAMAKAKDRDILNIFREIPDNTNWDHPTHWMRGGNIQLSRAFAEFARSDPDRAIRIMEQFERLAQERAAGYALDAMAVDAANDARLIDAFLDLHVRGFQTEEFRESAARAIEKIADRGSNLINDDVIDILAGWLRLPDDQSENEVEQGDIELKSKDELRDASILWGHGASFALPSGNYNILSTLASILLKQKEIGRDRYFAILEEHLSCERDPNIWKALLYRLGNAGGSTPQTASAFLRKLFARFPEILGTREAVIFLAYAQRWDDELVFDMISDWRVSEQLFLQRAYGELVGLVAMTKGKLTWAQEQERVIASGTEEMKIGLAHAAVNMWHEATLRERATETLVTLLNGASADIVAAVMDIFRLGDDFTPDAPTAALLRALADPSTDISAASAHFVVERLQALLPHEADLVAAIAGKLVAAWQSKLGDIRTEIAGAAPQLTDLALTLHRMGGESRQHGISLFESMIEFDAYGARETLAEIDGRFGIGRHTTRPRLPRRPRSRVRRREVH